MDDTIDEEEVLMIFDDNLKTSFPQNFVVDEWPTTNFPPALRVTANYE